MNIALNGVTQGLIWALLALGVYLSYRILDFADLSCEGTITLGASIAALMVFNQLNPWLALLCSFAAGCVAGAVTGLLHTKLKIPPILSGILTMTALFSINLRIMGSANIQLLGATTLYSSTSKLIGLRKLPTSLIIGGVICLALMTLLYWFFGTEMGSSIRATGNNEKMCRAQGIDTDLTKIIGLALSNGLIALSGSFLCQYQGYSNINMGVGSIVIGLASIIIGETLFSRVRNFFLKLVGIVVGAVLYRIVIAVVLFLNMPANDVKLMTAGVVVVALVATQLSNKIKKKSKPKRDVAAKEVGADE